MELFQWFTAVLWTFMRGLVRWYVYFKHIDVNFHHTESQHDPFEVENESVNCAEKRPGPFEQK